MPVRGLRGATIAEENTKESILAATTELLRELMAANGVDKEAVACAIFSTTRDRNAEFPAVAARQMGWDEVALLCGHEMDVPDAMAGVVRVMLLLNTEKSASQIEHVYLRETRNLRQRGVGDGAKAEA